MGCSCKDNLQEIKRYERETADLRSIFIKKMTVDSETQDRRKRTYNQAIFGYDEHGSTYAVWSEIDMDMILQCFDNAVKDWRRGFCDVDNCIRR